MSRGNSIAVGLALILAAMAFGCGSSGDAGEATVEGTVTKAQYLEQAMPICKLGINEITNNYGLWEKGHTVNGKRPPEAARDAALDQIALEAKAKQLERLRELPLPRESEGFVPRLYEAWEEGIENGEEDPESMQESNERYAFSRAYSMSVDYGLGDCWLG
jgi:hypothetical protein